MELELTAQEKAALRASLARNQSSSKMASASKPASHRNVTQSIIKQAEEPKPQSNPVNAPPKRTSKFGDLESVTVSLSAQPKKWKDSDIRSIKITRVSQLSGTEAISIGTEVVNTLRNGKITSKTIDQILSLAVSLYSPASVNTEAVFLMKRLPENYGTVIRESETAPTSINETKAALILQKLEKVRDRIARAAEGEDIATVRELEARLNEQLSGLEGVDEEDPAPLNVTDDAYAYTYLAAYIMRLAGKTASAWADKLEMAKTRFHSWYDCDSSILDNIDIDSDVAEKIREGMARRPDSIATWVLWAAYNENENKLLNPNDAGMLRYLVTQMYSYTGMHAYASIMQLQIEHNVTFKFLLEELNCPVTRKAVYEVADIIRHHEVTEQHSDRKTYFRYARVWDSGYFVNLQSKNCTVLGYTVAKARKMLSSSTTLSDPTQAFAFKNLDDKIRTSLDAVADRLYEKIMAMATQDEESGSIWKP